MTNGKGDGCGTPLWVEADLAGLEGEGALTFCSPKDTVNRGMLFFGGVQTCQESPRNVSFSLRHACFLISPDAK